MRHGRHLMVAAAEAPRERPKAAPQLGPPSLEPLAQSAPQADAFASFWQSIAAAGKVRRH
jgi:hypothetical protein